MRTEEIQKEKHIQMTTQAVEKLITKLFHPLLVF